MLCTNSIFWVIKVPTLSLLGKFSCSIDVFANMWHTALLFLVIAVEKTYFIEHTHICLSIDLYFNTNYRLATKNHYPGILNCSSEIRKFMKMSTSPNKTEHLFYKHQLVFSCCAHEITGKLFEVP